MALPDDPSTGREVSDVAITIEEARANIGRGVIYRHPYCEAEQGTITGVSETTVFVHYLGDMHPKGTQPGDLEWLSGAENTEVVPN